MENEKIIQKEKRNEPIKKNKNNTKSNVIKKKFIGQIINRRKENKKGITLVSLVVTIIILIILASVSINLVLGEEGIFTIAKKAKENMELAQIDEQEKLNALYTELELNTEGEGGNGGSYYDAIEKLLDFKKAIAEAIKEAGGIPPEDPMVADAEMFKKRIVGEQGIVAEVTKTGTATNENLLLGKIAWSKNTKLTGTMPNNNAVNQTLNAEESYTIPAGYHNGSGKVTANSLESQTPGNATAADIAKDKIAWVNGNKIIGTADTFNASKVGIFGAYATGMMYYTSSLGSRYFSINDYNDEYFTIDTNKTTLTAKKDCKIKAYLFNTENGKLNETQFTATATLYIDASLVKSGGIYEREIKAGQTIRFYAANPDGRYYCGITFFLLVS